MLELALKQPREYKIIKTKTIERPSAGYKDGKKVFAKLVIEIETPDINGDSAGEYVRKVYEFEKKYHERKDLVAKGNKLLSLDVSRILKDRNYRTYRIKKTPLVTYYTTFKSPVFKPWTAGPFTQYNKPMIEKIIYKGKKIYFGLINNKLVEYTVKFKDGKKQMDNYEVMFIKKNQNNREYLKNFARKRLNDLIENDDMTYFNKSKIIEIAQPHKALWPDLLREFSYVKSLELKEEIEELPIVS